MIDKSEHRLISVCIANFNGMSVIDDCLRSVQNQIGNLPVEIIVHDDASTDGSAEYIRLHYPEVVLLESAENVGFCVSNNRMVGRARGKYILLLNNDAALFPDALQAFRQEADRIREPAILGLPQYDANTGELLDIGSLLDPFLNSIPNLDPLRNDVCMVAGACLWMPRVLWDDLGGFPEWFGSIGEDLYLCCCARLAGYPVRVLGMSGFRHHVGCGFGGGKVADGRLRSTFRRRALSERNKTYVMVMTYPGWLLAPVLLFHLSLLMLEGSLLALLKGQRRYLTDIYMPVPVALWQNRQRLRAARANIEKRGRGNCADFFASFDWVPYKLRMLWRHGLPRLS
jgi:GT2 family glycosyltransferase